MSSDTHLDALQGRRVRGIYGRYAVENIVGEEVEDVAGWTIVGGDGYNRGALFFASLSDAERHIHDRWQEGERDLSAYALRSTDTVGT